MCAISIRNNKPNKVHEERVYDRENGIYYDVHSKNDRYVWPKPHKKHNKNFFFIFFSGQRAILHFVTFVHIVSPFAAA